MNYNKTNLLYRSSNWLSSDFYRFLFYISILCFKRKFKFNFIQIKSVLRFDFIICERIRTNQKAFNKHTGEIHSNRKIYSAEPQHPRWISFISKNILRENLEILLNEDMILIFGYCVFRLNAQSVLMMMMMMMMMMGM